MKTQTFCFCCQKYKQTAHFSDEQMALSAYTRRCPECLTAKEKAKSKRDRKIVKMKAYSGTFIDHMTRL